MDKSTASKCDFDWRRSLRKLIAFEKYFLNKGRRLKRQVYLVISKFTGLFTTFNRLELFSGIEAQIPPNFSFSGLQSFLSPEKVSANSP